MEFDKYQELASATDQVAETGDESDDHLVVPLLGMAGEVGSLLVEYKKQLRDGPAHSLFEERISEELGDILWYVSNLATKFGLSLDSVAQTNIEKTRDRWLAPDPAEYTLFDAENTPDEQIPRQFVVELTERKNERGEVEVFTYVDGEQRGNELQDNSHVEDGYRYHDIFHLAFAAYLGWSPVVRKLLGCKRPSVRSTDMVEDGGRATVIDEALVAIIFEYAEDHAWLDEVSRIDFGLLSTLKGMTVGLEVSKRTRAEWEQAVLAGFRVWRETTEHHGGKIRVDLEARTLEFLGPTVPN